MRRNNKILLYRMCHTINLLEDLRGPEGRLSLMTEVYVSEEIQMEGDPASFEEVMRSAHSSKWVDAMENKMRSMSVNKV
jgi:hypothetical protein